MERKRWQRQTITYLKRITPDTPPQQFLLISQIVFYTTVLLCLLIAPESLTANAGLSYFGHTRDTVVIFVVGLFTCCYFLLKAEQYLQPFAYLNFLRHALILIIIGVVGVAVAPAIGNGWLDRIHRVFGSLTFVAQLLLACWLLLKIHRDSINWLILAVQCIGGIIAFVYLAPAHGYSLQGQLLFQLAFSALLLRCIIYGRIGTRNPNTLWHGDRVC